MTHDERENHPLTQQFRHIAADQLAWPMPPSLELVFSPEEYDEWLEKGADSKIGKLTGVMPPPREETVKGTGEDEGSNG